ncbi:hypothetical protein [Azotobacter chroococcum]|uniref:hypothetical protein n=1 Tax=Azotobacter chroococcum TaxID=353 RepID=UPI001E40B161|nr:hypothetical protein [Azotobacter chroococcum]
MLASAADIQAIERVITRQRLSTYAGALGMRNARRTLDLYAWNAQVAGAFMLPQQICEVAIRNAAGEVLEAVYGHQWPWALGFERSLPDPKFGFSLRKELSSARGKAPAGNTNKVIPELKFAFWGKLFTQRFDSRLWLPHLRGAFHGLPAGLPVQQCRQMIYEELDKVRGLRNRIAHHEPIFQRNLAADYARIARLVGWRCPRTAAWMDEVETVRELLGARP